VTAGSAGSGKSDSTRNRRIAWGARLGVVILRTLASTWRVQFLNPRTVSDVRESGGRVIYVLWHGSLLPLLWSHRDRDIAVIISEHSDGEIIARIAKALGFRTVRGSTSRGAARALLGACREIEGGHDLAVTVDGPRGPARTVAPGAPAIAQRTGAAMVPVDASASRAWRLRSWDRFMIPKPFARVTIAYDEPIRVPADTARDGNDERERVRAGIERAGETATAQ
jgi:lysophospholipid acyltransferase (LPLAT)-like uncharacterized protein